MKIFIVLLCLLPIWAQAGISSREHLVTHIGTQVYGDIQVGPTGEVTILNGKTIEQAAQTFWPAVRARYGEISKSIRSGAEKTDWIGFYFPANNGKLRMNRIKRKLAWQDYDPRPEDRLVWDEVCRIYQID